MKYSNDEAFEEIRRRGREMKRQREKMLTEICAAASGTLSLSLLLVIGLFTEDTAGTGAYSHYGSFLLSPEAGGYILAAVIAFALGVAVTLLIRYLKKKKKC